MCIGVSVGSVWLSKREIKPSQTGPKPGEKKKEHLTAVPDIERHINPSKGHWWL